MSDDRAMALRFKVPGRESSQVIPMLPLFTA